MDKERWSKVTRRFTTSRDHTLAEWLVLKE